MSKAREWKELPLYEGLYEVSSDGLLRSTKRQGSSGGNRSFHLDKRGYKRITLCKDGKSKNHLVHALVARAFLGERPDGLNVCHKDGDKLNNSIDNLYYGTHSDNTKDAVLHGTHNFLKENYSGKTLSGEECIWSKLTEDSVKYIRSMYGIKSTRALAKELSVTQGTVSAVQTGKTWRHVT